MPQVRKTLAKKGLHLDDVSVASAAHHKQLHLHLREILRNIMGVCALFNHSLGNFMLESHTFLEIVVSTFNHLLRFCPFDNSKPEPTVDAIYHIGLTLFMMTMFLHRGRRRVVDHELVSVRLRHLLDSELDDYDDELIFWLVTICGIWVTDAADGDWPVPMMHDTAQRLGVDTWSKAQAVVRRFPWLNSVHDEPGLNLWNKVSLYQRF